MTVSQINSSYGGYYDTLTSPFLIKRVYVNAYTPYNEAQPTEETFSRGDFPRIKDTSGRKLAIKSHNVGIINLSKSSADVVKNMITDGYSATNALDISKAVNAYGMNALNASGVTTLSTNSYEA